MYKKGRVNSNSRIISTDEDPSLRIVRIIRVLYSYHTRIIRVSYAYIWLIRVAYSQRMFRTFV